MLVLCTVAQRFGPRAPADDVTPEPSMTPRPKGGVPEVVAFITKRTGLLRQKEVGSFFVVGG